MINPFNEGLRHRLHTRLLLLTVGVTVLVLAAVILWSHFSVLGRLEIEARERAAFLAEGSADKIDAQMALLQGLVRGMALVLETQALAVPFEQLRVIQDEALRVYPQVYGMAVALLPELKPVDWPGAAPYAYRTPSGLDYLDLGEQDDGYLSQDWLHLPRYLGRGSWSEPYVWSTGVKMVTYSEPIELMDPDGGSRFAGVVTIDIDLGWLDEALAKLPVGTKGYGLIMTHRGTYLSHPMSTVVFNESVFSIAEARADQSLRQLGQRMVSGEPGLIPWVSWAQGEPSWLAWYPLATADWTVGTVVSQAELKAEIRHLSQQDALIGLIGTGVLVLAIWLVGRSITRPVQALSAAATTLAAGNLDAPLPAPRGQDEVAQLTYSFLKMRENLRHYIADLAETTAARERIAGELRIAHSIQMDLLPKRSPALFARADLDLFADMEPAREVGGDFYDFFLLDAERLVVAIGDVSGKGVPAALFMAVTRSYLRAAFRADDDPGRALDRVNEDLAEGNDSCMFVTLFCAVVRLADGQMAYANAGHNPPAVIDAQGHLEWIAKPSGPAAAVIPGSRYATGHYRLKPDAALLLYTDGVTEAMDREDRLYGVERLARCMSTLSDVDCKAAVSLLLADIRAHAAGTEQSDDITILMLRRIARGHEMTMKTTDEGVAELCLSLANHQDDLGAALDQLDLFLEKQCATPRFALRVRLVIEELVTNTIKYGYDDANEHRISLVLTLDKPARLRIEDDGHPFDPTVQTLATPLNAALEERPIGGLGLHMVRAETTSLSYQRCDGINRLDLVLRD